MDNRKRVVSPELKIARLESKLKIMSYSLCIPTFLVIVLTLSGWHSTERTLRVTKLELVDENGQVRAVLSADKSATKFQMTGPKPKGWRQNSGSPPLSTVSVEMTVNTVEFSMVDESGSVAMDTQYFGLRDPNTDETRISLRREEYNKEKKGNSYLQVSSKEGIPILTLPKP